MNKFLRQLELISTNVVTARNDDSLYLSQEIKCNTYFLYIQLLLHQRDKAARRLPYKSSCRLQLQIGFRFTFLHLLHFYQAYTLVMQYCHITGGGQIGFQNIKIHRQFCSLECNNSNALPETFLCFKAWLFAVNQYV